MQLVSTEFVKTQEMQSLDQPLEVASEVQVSDAELVLPSWAQELQWELLLQLRLLLSSPRRLEELEHC